MKMPKNNLIKISLLLAIFVGLICIVPGAFSQYGSVDDEINDLNLKIQNQKKQLDAIQQRQKEYQAQIELKQKDKINLNNQLAILENRLAKAQLDIESVNIEIDKTDLEIKKIGIDSDNLDQAIDKQKTHIASLLRSMYKQDQVSTLEILLLNNSLSDFLDQAQYLADTNKEIGDSLASLKDDKTRLEQNKIALDENNTELAALKSKLEEKRNNLSYEQENKTYILEETKSSEKEYQALLQKSKREQQQAEAEIANAEQLIRQKMSQKDKNKLNNGNNTIAWPVPKNVIVASFHDADYPYRNIIGEHPAVDIRAKQGTTLTAAADGYVAKVKFDGNRNYAYIMIIHGNGLATVYGHVSAVYVMTDQYVTQGQAIGRSGGMPGGIGSGGFTTGPHLHFEVRLNGLPVNPENYLP
ncbi:MAG: peptidoglycan DD-metalloendopeptidase family protein [Patescibacteria group bacterium]|jgi:murein DD-endopeptidase MepM/ murein hydrolase activator NlpD